MELKATQESQAKTEPPGNLAPTGRTEPTALPAKLAPMDKLANQGMTAKMGNKELSDLQVTLASPVRTVLLGQTGFQGFPAWPA